MLAENGGARESSMDGTSSCRNHLSTWLNGQKGVGRVLAKIDALEGGRRLAENIGLPFVCGGLALSAHVKLICARIVSPPLPPEKVRGCAGA